MIMVEYDRSSNVSRPAGHYTPHHGSPHLQHLERPSAHSTPSPTLQFVPLPHLQNQQGPPVVRSTPTSYPSPASYPSPSMGPAYQYAPSQQQQQQQQQPNSRGSPYSQPASINLPPIRLNPPQLTQTHGDPRAGYYPLPPPANVHNITSSPTYGHMQQQPQQQQQQQRFPLLPSDSDGRVMSGGRHKKEIKRRTKTGCLTCRKRRIKCDEGHPTCKNCAKSKRDCLGYDPIFKQQQQEPPAIQPAPSQGQVGHPGAPNMYGMPGTNMPPGPYLPALSATGSSPASSCDPYEYQSHTPQIDPALEATSHPMLAGPGSLLDAQTTYRPELKRALDRSSPFSTASDTGRPSIYTPIPRSDMSPAHAFQHDGRGDSRAKRIKIDDLLSVGSQSLSSVQPLSPPSSELATSASEKLDPRESMKHTYINRYAGALDSFLEVNWFKTEGWKKMCMDAELQDKMAEVFGRLRTRGGSYVEEEDPIIIKAGAESDLLWAAVKMTYGTRIPVADTRKDGRGSEDRALEGPINGALDPEGKRALRRIELVESLLAPTDERAMTPGASTSPPPNHGEQSEDKQPDAFWDILEESLNFSQKTGDDIESDGSGKHFERLMSQAEGLAGDRENRQLLTKLAELHRSGSCADPANRLILHFRKAVEDKAKDLSPAAIDSIERRIAGRAVATWKDTVIDLPCCMTPPVN